MKWVTREKVKVDRVACPWLIKKFVDPQAEFLFVPADKVMETAAKVGATPFDVPNVELGEAMAQVAALAIGHKPYPKTVWFNFEILTKENVGSYKPWADRLKAGPLKITFVNKGGKTFVQTTPNFGG